MQAADDNGAGRVAARANGPRGPGNRSVVGHAGAATGIVFQRELAARAPGPGGSPAPADRAGSFLNVPFPTSLEAEMVCRFLMLNVRDPGLVLKSFRVTHRIMTVQLTAEDPDQLRSAIVSCVDHLWQ
ncbi:EKC/KEOPS complex subunit Lage3-like, partial [Orycteropus afer afer]|uniref:EKC/KEOPS complex subunit Lage3-like n=1 Tax=Orycteropus afer afer TaxID=1230840 RepID=A0A8B7BC07_ORYAF